MDVNPRELPLFLRNVLQAADSVTAESLHKDFPNDPETLAYVHKLKAGIFWGRTFIAYYNWVLLLVLVAFAVLHWRESRQDRQRWRARLSASPGTQDAVDFRAGTGGGTPDPYGTITEAFSSETSTIQGTITPPEVRKGGDINVLDVESLPLLGSRAPFPRTHSGTRIYRRVAYWLAYQPRPIPFVNRTLPSNAVSLFVLTWLGLNVFFHLYGQPFDRKYLFLFADRAGIIFIVNLPLLYILAAKNQPIKLLTGRSYEALNIFHRRVGEFLCFEALVHLITMLMWYFWIGPDWARPESAGAYFFHPIIVFGFVAFAAYELLYFSSLASFRQRWYELFLASHIILQILALVFLWLHFHTARPYVAAALMIFLVDRLVYRLGLKTTSTTADITILQDGETIFLSTEWDIPPTTPQHHLLPAHDILHGWRPTDHVFLTVPALGRSHSLQAHPFTIASAAPSIPSWTTPPRPLSTSPPPPLSSPAHKPTPTRLDLLIRTHAGFTASLLSHARLLNREVSISLDGPYGSSHALSLLRATDTAVLVAGGSGIAVVYPLAAALLLHDHPLSSGRRQSVHLLWVTRSRSHHDWIPRDRLAELVAAGLDVVIPPPTTEAGRPDVEGVLDGWVRGAAARGAQAGVVVSGPDGMNRQARNVCARAIGDGVDVRVAVEKFGW